MATITALLVTYIATKVNQLASLPREWAEHKADMRVRLDGITNRLDRIEKEQKAQA